MPEPRTHTAALARVAKLAELALLEPEGITVKLTVDKYGSHKACGMMARSLQQSFTSLRARERKKVRIDNYIDPISRFDALICQRVEMANEQGWLVRFHREDACLEAWEIVSNATGDSLTLDMTDDAVHERLSKKLLADPEHFTIAERVELERIAPAWAEFQIAGDKTWNALHGAQGAIRIEDLDLGKTSNDPNDIPLDIDPFTGEIVEP